MYIEAVCLIDQLISRLSQELLNMVENGTLGTTPQSDLMLLNRRTDSSACSRNIEFNVLCSVCKIRCLIKLLLTQPESVIERYINVSSPFEWLATNSII